jgi:transposase-like protein
MKDEKQYLTISNIEEMLEKFYKNRDQLLLEFMFFPFFEALKKEIEEKAGKKYKHDGQYYRWSSNPGSISVNGEKVRVKVPRIKDKQSGKVETPEIYNRVKKNIHISERIMKKLLAGISQKRYKETAQELANSFGLSQSSVSRIFTEEAEKYLKEFEGRKLNNYDILAIIIDGKYLKKDQIVYAIRLTNTGYKIILGFIQTNTENTEAIKGLLKDLINRGLKYERGILFVTDGSKGIIKAIGEVFGKYAAIQRCQWHKRENVVSYLIEELKEKYRNKLQRAYLEPEYVIAKSRLLEIHKELQMINRTASNSLLEGLEETLTIHKLGVRDELGRSLGTTNIIESTNSQLASRLRRIKFWKSSQMIANWIAINLLDIEKRMKRIHNYQRLKLLELALIDYVSSNKHMVA